MQLIAHRIDDARIGLMRKEPVHIGCCQLRLFKRIGRAVCHHTNGLREDGSSVLHGHSCVVRGNGDQAVTPAVGRECRPAQADMRIA